MSNINVFLSFDRGYDLFVIFLIHIQSKKTQNHNHKVIFVHIMYDTDLNLPAYHKINKIMSHNSMNYVAWWHKYFVCEHYYVACWHNLSCMSAIVCYYRLSKKIICYVFYLFFKMLFKPLSILKDVFNEYDRPDLFLNCSQRRRHN